MIHQSLSQCSSFNRLSIAYLRLNLLEADCSARERDLRHFARMEKAPRLGVCDGNAHSRERIKLSLAGRTHVDCQDGRRVGSLNAGIHTILECANMPALLKQ
jgi:hypothetical protein